MKVGTAFILAAGLGTRLKPFSDRLPKPAWPLFDRPIACHLLDSLSEAGVDEFIINLHHLPEELKGAVEPHLPPGASVNWSFEERILGTGGALTPWLNRLDAPFFLANADTHRSFSPAEMAEFHESRGAEVTLSLAPLPEGARGPVEVDGTGRIVKFLGAKAPHGGRAEMACDFTGVHLIGPTLAPEIGRAASEGEKFCINADVHSHAVASGRGYFGFFPSDGRWSDLGTPGRYLEGHFEFLKGGQLPRRTTGVLVKADFTTPDGGRVAAPSYLGVGAKVEAGAVAGPYAVLCPGARLEAGATVRSAVVWPGTRVSGEVSGIVANWGEVMNAEGVVRSEA